MSLFFVRNKIILLLLLILLAVSPAFALGEGNRNLLLIGIMGLSPFFLLFYPIIIPKIDIPLIGLCTMMCCFPAIFHPDTLRWNTILYSCMYCCFFMSFTRILYNSDFSIVDLKKILKGLIYAYCIVLLIQQFCVLTGLPIFNVSNYNPATPWKLNSLMSEPSHSARVIPLLMFFYVDVRKNEELNYDLRKSLNEDRLVWIAFLWPMITMGSSTAFIFFLIVLSHFVSFRRYFIPSLVIVLLFLSAFIFSENAAIKRARKTVLATITFNETAIIHADHSASFRIVPTIQGMHSINLVSVNDWFGHGVDADTRLIRPLPTVKRGNAGAFSVWFNFGFLAAVTYWLFSFFICYQRKKKSTILIWFLIIFLYGGFNTQIVWLALCLSLTYKYINQKDSLSLNQDYNGC